MRLFKRQKSAGTSCPRCSQLVTAGDGDVCPMCGWDMREAYQGPATAPHSPTSTSEPTEHESDDSTADHRVA
jgi:hypothetical protein